MQSGLLLSVLSCYLMPRTRLCAVIVFYAFSHEQRLGLEVTA